jgi:NifB/MoaA-like Fe-S oxidoreductase
VVLCPKINAGEILRRTIYDLAELHPKVSSVAIVPLGLTRYLDDPRLTPVTPEFCQHTIAEVSEIQKDLRKQVGSTFAFLGDEIYLKAGQDVPSRKHYGDYPQIEDGIGMVRSFTNEFETLMKGLTRNGTPALPARTHSVEGTMLTGSLFAPVLRKLIDQFNQAFYTRLHVVGVANEYFGGDVSVAGLLAGGDFVAARAQVTGDFAIIPRVALKSDEPILLDGMRFEEVRQEFPVPLHAFDSAELTSFLSNLVCPR